MPATDATAHVQQVRAASLAHYVEVARSSGLDPYAMLRELGIDPQLLGDPDARLPANLISRLLAESALRSGCETFGLRLAELRSFASLGPLTLLVRHERSLRAVLERMMSYRRLITDIIEIDLLEEEEESRIVVTVTPDVATRQCVELAMGLNCRFLSGAMFGGWRPTETHFRHPAPADTSVHQRIFRSRLRFDSSFNGYVVPTASLDRENAYGDPGLVTHAEHYVDLLARELPVPTLADQVRSAVKRLIASGGATLPKVAGQLGLHPRALQRRLAAEGLAFADLVETIREHLARDLLANTNLPLIEVALLTGYASPASFSRWFAGLSGLPPREWRLRNRPRSAA
jgi:AraC-like DNA-binding protein